MSDKWLTWLTEKRFGGSKEAAAQLLEVFGPIRDEVLANAAISEGSILLDVGTGDGLIAFEALKRVGDTGKVIFSDISEPSLDHCRALVNDLGKDSQAEFVIAPASDLSQIADDFVDAVTTRSVLIYESNKAHAFEEFFRVLKPGGRISLFEPIASVVSRFSKRPNTFAGYDLSSVAHLLPKLAAVYGAGNAAQSPMSDFDERDLVEMALRAGFGSIEAKTNILIHPVPMYHGNWEAFYNASPNPNALSPSEAIEKAFTDEEAAQFIATLKPLVEEGKGTSVNVVTYLWARK